MTVRLYVDCIVGIEQYRLRSCTVGRYCSQEIVDLNPGWA